MSPQESLPVVTNLATEATSGPDSKDRKALLSAHRTILLVFFANGLMLATWLVRIPTVKESTGLSAGTFGVVLTLPVVGSLLSMQLSRYLVPRTGTAGLLRLSVPVAAALLWAVGLSGNGIQLGATLLLFGLADGLLFVGMTTQGVEVEKRSGRSRMNAYHAAWSLGTLAGSLLGGLAIWAGAGTGTHLCMTGLLCLLLTMPAMASLLADRPDRPPSPSAESAPSGPTRRSGSRRRSVLLLGCLGMACLVSQGAIEDWGAVYLREERSASPALASFAFIAFCATLVLGRLCGDALRDRLRVSILLRCCSALACLGMLLVVVGPGIWWPLAGFALFGAGLSVLDPVISSVAGHQVTADGETGTAASAVADVATLSHTGLLIGPPCIGLLSQWTGLTSAIAIPALLVLGVGACSGFVASAAEPVTRAG
ncbi:MFS transporter [Streptomyces sp. NPDC088270]|uniref:MFS transporter n=1 Tax=Streptomyces sp. NPDC088270 TaxID=3160990 RepID=UPI003449B32A